MIIVSDSGPILSFARAGRLEILRQVAGEITIPGAVFEEITVGGQGKPGAGVVLAGTWIKCERVKDRSALNRLSRRLNLGEMEAVVLAGELGASLLVDEYEDRKEAERIGIEYFGSLRILKEAKERGLIQEIKPILDGLIASGTYVSDTLYQEFLRVSGEPIT
jgi:predicted nucleic acid-binding protein